MNTFDPATHTYRIDGVIVPSVTQVLASVGYSHDEPWFTEEARERGTVIHMATAADDRGVLDQEILTDAPWLVPYVEAWRAFRVEMVKEITATEAQRYDDYRMFAGTVDRIAITRDSRRMILDIKPASDSPAYRLQTAGYHLLDGGGGIKRAAVHLRDDGTYRFEPHDDPSDLAAFEAALTLTHWKTNNERRLPWVTS
jgi:hypothetical protein